MQMLMDFHIFQSPTIQVILMRTLRLPYSTLHKIDCLPLTAQQVQQATVLSHVLQYTKNRWPAAVDDSLKVYFNKQQEITVERGCLLWRIRVIVPVKLRKEVLDELHRDYLGIVRMKNKACSHVWQPGVDFDIEGLVHSCLPCQTVRNAALLHTKPWKTVHIDFGI